jgi:hypothetical protein
MNIDYLQNFEIFYFCGLKIERSSRDEISMNET